MKEFGKRTKKPIQEPQWLVEKRATDAEEKRRRLRSIKNKTVAIAAMLGVVTLLSLPQTGDGLGWIADQVAPQVLASF